MAIPEKSQPEAVVDFALIERCRLGDQLAFEALFTKYQHRILKLINQNIRNFSDSHDLTQEVFMRAFESIKQFRGESSFYTWLYRIAMNVAKNHTIAKRREGHTALNIDQAEQLSCQSCYREAIAMKAAVIRAFITEADFL